MTIFQLQNDLAKEVENILKGMLFKVPEGKDECMRTFCQDLPKREHSVQIGNLMDEEQDEEDLYPFCVVRAESGNIIQGAQNIRTILIIGIFNDDIQNRGYEELVNVIHRITERFIKNPVLEGKYMLNQKAGISWILDDEDRYPYFLGGIEMSWDTFFVEREDRYA